jgi:L-erythro-3,5-diaminohexanoate dehydrogenase
MPQPALRLDNDFTRLFDGELLVAVDTLNIDAASFAQIEEAAAHERGSAAPLESDIATAVLGTVADRGKQHNTVTGSGGMLLGRVLQVTPARRAEGMCAGERIATLASLTLTPLRLDRIRAVRRASAQLDVDGEAVLFATAPFARLPGDLPERVALAALDVAGAAPQVARLVRPGHTVVVLGAGGKSGILCAVQARENAGAAACIVGVESRPEAARELEGLGVCSQAVVADATDPVALRAAVLQATGGAEANVTLSCVNVSGAELGAILVTRERGTAYFFAMSTSFTRAALGAEGVSKDIDLLIGNGYARRHAEHTLGMLKRWPALRALFERRYG